MKAEQSEAKKVTGPAKGTKPAVQTAKAASPRKRSGKKLDGQGSIAPEERRKMIEVRAYFLAQQRGFAPGNQEQDWLAAEAQIDAMLIQNMTLPGAMAKHS
ncbi:MAG: DUF2934 domain-containing protein [Burkholderiales bacterium]